MTDEERPGLVGRFTRWMGSIGRRAAFLALFGLAWIGYSFSLPASLPPRPGVAPLLIDYVPTAVQVTYYLTAGSVAVLAVLVRRRSWEAWGFAAITFPVAIRSVSFMIAWIQYVILGPAFGMRTDWAAGLINAVIIGAIMMVASWPDPGSDVLRAARRGRQPRTADIGPEGRTWT